MPRNSVWKNNNNKSFNVLHIGIYLINLEEGAPRYDDLRSPKSISIFPLQRLDLQT